MELLEQSSFNTVAVSTQGVCFDGTHYYVSDSTKLYKYTTAGVKVAERDCSSYGTVHHLGDLCVVGGILYVVADNYPSTPKVGYIQQYNASDLSYRNTETQVHTDKWTSSVCYDGTNFYTVTNDNLIQKWETGFTSPTTITPDFTPGSGHGWNGIVKDGDTVYLNIHSGTEPTTVQKFTLVGGELKLDYHLPRPAGCTQGLDLDGDVLIMALRDAAVVRAKEVPYDYRQNNLIAQVDAGTRTTTSTGYVEQSNLKVSLPVKKDDVIEVQLQGLFKTTTSMRAYINPSTTNTCDVTDIYNPRTIRSQSSASEMDSLAQTRHYKANEDGTATFSMQWKQISSGAATSNDRTMSARVIGKYT